MQLWQGVNMNAPAQLPPQEAGSTAQALLDLRQLILVQRAEKHFGVRIIRRQFNRRQADHADARIFQLAAYQFGQIAAYLLRDPIRTFETVGLTFHYSDRAISWISYASS